MRVEGVPAEHFADDRLRGAAVGRGQAHPERLRQQVFTSRARSSRRLSNHYTNRPRTLGLFGARCESTLHCLLSGSISIECRVFNLPLQSYLALEGAAILRSLERALHVARMAPR